MNFRNCRVAYQLARRSNGYPQHWSILWRRNGGRLASSAANRFACAMILPCNDPRDSAGLETRLREIAAVAETHNCLSQDEQNFGSERGAGLDAVGRLVDDGICAGIKYAVVRSESADDPYLESLLTP